MILSSQGESAESLLHRVEQRFHGLVIDSFVIMPDHVHAILMLGTDPKVELNPSAGDVVQWFKIKFQATYGQHVVEGSGQPYRKQLWQRGFHDQMIRNDHELNQIREYIHANPARWTERLTRDHS